MQRLLDICLLLGHNAHGMVLIGVEGFSLGKILTIIDAGLFAADVAHGVDGDKKFAHGHDPEVAALIGELRAGPVLAQRADQAQQGHLRTQRFFEVPPLFGFKKAF